MDNFYNKTMSITTEGGSKVELNFEGEAIYVYGFSSINGGKGEVWLDGVLQSNLNMAVSLHISLLAFLSPYLDMCK